MYTRTKFSKLSRLNLKISPWEQLSHYSKLIFFWDFGLSTVFVSDPSGPFLWLFGHLSPLSSAVLGLPQGIFEFCFESLTLHDSKSEASTASWLVNSLDKRNMEEIWQNILTNKTRNHVRRNRQCKNIGG